MSGTESFQGISAVVIGASSDGGFGAAIARRFVALGASVAIAGRRRDALEQTAELIGAEPFVCDITDEAALETLFASAGGAGPVRIAVNAAGINHARPLKKLTAAELRAQADVHFVGTALFIKAAANAMVTNEPPGGSIITVSSLTATQPAAALAAYAGSKAGADHVVRVAAQEFGANNIRVNSISPGLAKTPLTAALFEQPNVTAAFAAESPLGRLTEIEHVVDAAVFLGAQDNFMTGQNLHVSGGASLNRLPTAREMAGR